MSWHPQSARPSRAIPTQLKVVGTWSNLSQYKNFEQPFWSKEITEKSGGAITADIKGFNEMGLKGGEIGRLMKQGVIDFGSTVLGYMASDDTKNEAMDLAGLEPRHWHGAQGV